MTLAAAARRVDRPARAWAGRTVPPGCARAYARHLLTSLHRTPDCLPAGGDNHPAQAWAESGLMALTGTASGPPRMCPAPVAACADGVMLALAGLAPEAGLGAPDGARFLTERAAIFGHGRNGAISPGGSCRLLPAADGWLAVNLPRDDDWDMLPAWLEMPAADWDGVASAIATRGASACVQRARLMGLAVARADALPPSPAHGWVKSSTLGAAVPHPRRRPVVLDLSALWAGPLCGHMLQRLGARVIKVESVTRPDGARRGPPAFFDLLNGGKASVALDLGSGRGRRRLRDLIARADIVIESTRPRALRQLGIVPERLVRRLPGLTWVSITGYGRSPARSEWVGFGDDAGAAAGLSRLLQLATGEMLFCGDAIADPLTGLHAALAAWAGHRAGGGRLLSLSLRDVAASCAGFARPASTDALRRRQAEWTRVVDGRVPDVPRPRPVTDQAPALGAHNNQWLTERGDVPPGRPASQP